MCLCLCVCLSMSVSVCTYVCISVYVSVVCICVCVCLYTCLCPSVPVYRVWPVSMYPCLCWGPPHLPAPALLGELCPEQGAYYGSQRRGREGRGRGGEGRAGPYVCLRGESPLWRSSAPSALLCSLKPPCGQGSRSLVPAGPTGTRESSQP